MDQQLEVARHVEAPVDEVWRVLTDLEGTAEVLRGVSAVERLAGTGFEVGTRWRETRRMMGVQATEEMEVAAVEPQRRILITAHSHGMDYESGFTVEQRGAGTLLVMFFRGASAADPGPLRRVLGAVTAPLGAAVSRKAMAQDLQDIAAVAEGRA